MSETLLRVGGKEGRALVAASVDYPGTNAVVRNKMRALLDAADLESTVCKL